MTSKSWPARERSSSKGSFFDGAVVIECVRQADRKDRLTIQFFRPGKYEVSFSGDGGKNHLPVGFTEVVGRPKEKVIERKCLPGTLGVEIAIEKRLEKHYL